MSASIPEGLPLPDEALLSHSSPRCCRKADSVRCLTAALVSRNDDHPNSLHEQQTCCRALTSQHEMFDNVKVCHSIGCIRVLWGYCLLESKV